MATVPATVVTTRPYGKRPPLELTARRLAANRRNAARATGPRSPKGKARVARNAIKHGFFTGPERWSERQHRQFAEVFDGLCEDFHPHSAREEVCVAALADSFVRMAGLMRYENLAAVKYHRQCEREIEERIANANAEEAARLRAGREKLRRAGLWRPTIPGPREAMAIIRYEGRLDRTIRNALAEFEIHRKARKQTHLIEEPRGFFRSARSAHSNGSSGSASSTGGDLRGRGESAQAAANRPTKPRKQTHLIEHNRDLFQFADRVFKHSMNAMRELTRRKAASANAAPARPEAQRIQSKTAKTNPLSAALAGNRHERRRAAALARRNR